MQFKDLLREPLASNTYLVNAELEDGWMPVGGLCLSMMPEDFRQEWSDILESPVTKLAEDGAYGREIHVAVSDGQRLQDFPFAILTLKNPMTREEFDHAIRRLIPESSSALTEAWAGLAEEITGHAKAWLADSAEEIQRGESQRLSAWYRPRAVTGNNLQEIHASLYNIQQRYGTGICRQIYELAKIPFCSYPLEAPLIAEYLSKGGDPAEIERRYEAGEFEWDIPDDPALLTPADQQSAGLPASRKAEMFDDLLDRVHSPLPKLEPTELTMM